MKFPIQVHACCSAHTPYLPEVLERGREGRSKEGEETEKERTEGIREEVGGSMGREWVSRWNDWGEHRDKVGNLGKGGAVDLPYGGRREKHGGIICYVDESRWIIKS